MVRSTGEWPSNGPALLTELGSDQVVAEDKELNGKIEVFNADLHKELFDR